MAEQVIVIGAGIVGICTALALREKGFGVGIIDRDGAAEGASFGNAGIISPWSCVPQSLPGVWKNVPKWHLGSMAARRDNQRDRTCPGSRWIHDSWSTGSMRWHPSSSAMSFDSGANLCRA